VLDLSVEACSFHASPLSSPAAIFLPAAVDVHVDSGATVSAVIERNIFRGTAVAARLTASDDLPGLGAAGRLQARIRGNLIHGEPAAPGPGLPAAFSVRHAFYLSLFPNHELDLLFAHNTVVGVEGFVVHEDNLDLLRERGKVVPFTFANNICRQVRASSEFAAEVDGPAFPQTARGVVIASNLLEKSSVGREEIAGNFTAPPGFVDEAGFDFHLLAGSPAVNRGDNLHAEGLAVDLDGRCRITATQCGGEKTALFLVDLGCYESDGTCGPDDVLFRRGDCNGSGTFDLTDAVFTFTFLFLGGERPACGDGCDADDSGAVNLTDGIYFLNYLFLGGEPPPAPYPESGVDPTCDQLPCR
jgi:hypothetical protein